jgi:Tfp pilus assembly PilM family ATPase
MRVAALAVDALPRRRDEVRDLVSWRLKKTLPYRADEAVLDWQVFPPAAGGKRVVLAAAVRRRILEEYEGVLEEAGLEAGQVTASSLALSDALPQVPERDTMLLNVGSGWFSVLVTDGREPLFFRSKSVPEGERFDGLREAFIASELFPTLEFYRSRLEGRGLAPIVLHAAGGGAEAIEAALRQGEGVDASLLPARSVEAPVPGDLPAALQARLAAVAALGMRGWHHRPEAGTVAMGGAA